MPGSPLHARVHALVPDASGRILVLRRRQRAADGAGLWELPGGPCAVAEPVATSLVREVAAQTGLWVTIRRLAAALPGSDETNPLGMLLMETASAGGELALDETHDAARWIPVGALDRLALAPELAPLVSALVSQSEPAAPPFDETCYRGQVAGFAAIRPRYQQLAGVLETILAKGAVELGHQVIVQARAKTLASFAEKIVRPGRGDIDPLRDLTDLCGARVIARTLSDVAELCHYVETHFDIAWADSVDKLQTLDAREFGYLSRHYIVTLRPGVFPEDTVPPDLVGLGLKAEIQVRTILQHAWADFSHSLSYKADFDLPRRIERELARLAAVLEESDRRFDAIRNEIQQFARANQAHQPPEQARAELARLDIVRSTLGSADPELDHRLARLAMTLEDLDRAVAVLEPYEESGPAALRRDLGVCLCRRSRAHPHGPDFLRGQRCLIQATEIDPRDVDAWAALGGSYRVREQAATEPAERAAFRDQARTCYRRAFELDPADPYPVGNALEYALADHPGADILPLLRPVLEAARKRSQAQLEAGLNRPWAHFDLGRFALLLGKPYEALGHYAAGVDAAPLPSFLDSALASFRTLEPARPRIAGLDWCEGLLRVARTFRAGMPADGPAPQSSAATPLRAPVLILAGTCAAPLDPELEQAVLEALRGFRGTVISGGSNEGVCGLVGAIQQQAGANVQSIGYIAGGQRDAVTLDARYSEIRVSPGLDFSPLEPVQYWSDLSASGVRPDQMTLVATGGGAITTAECQMALALGVSVVLVESRRETTVERTLSLPPWHDHRQLTRVPRDVRRLRAALGLD